MKTELVTKAYEVAKERYAEIGIDTEKVLKQLQDFHLSLHCWQADDVKGFEVQAGGSDMRFRRDILRGRGDPGGAERGGGPPLLTSRSRGFGRPPGHTGYMCQIPIVRYRPRPLSAIPPGCSAGVVTIAAGRDASIF